MISTIIFLYQCLIALNKLNYPPVVDSTQILDVKDVDLPLLTLCPKLENQFDAAKMVELGYSSYYGYSSLRKGTLKNVSIGISWGAHLNLTFKKLLKKARNEDMNRSINPLINTEQFTETYYPGLGFCLERTEYLGEMSALSNTYELFDLGLDEYEIFLTDKDLKTYNTIFASSQWGSWIIIDWRNRYNHFLRIKSSL